MKSDLDYWIEVDRQKERALKRLELEEREKQLKKEAKRWQARKLEAEKREKQTTKNTATTSTKESAQEEAN